MTELTLKLFTDHFNQFYEVFCNDDSHPEYFFEMFFDEYICEKELLDPSEKEEWVKQFQDDLGDEVDAHMSFDEIVEEYPMLKEDVTSVLIDDNPKVREKAIPELYEWIKQYWIPEVIESTLKSIKTSPTS